MLAFLFFKIGACLILKKSFMMYSWERSNFPVDTGREVKEKEWTRWSRLPKHTFLTIEVWGLVQCTCYQDTFNYLSTSLEWTVWIIVLYLYRIRNLFLPLYEGRGKKSPELTWIRGGSMCCNWFCCVACGGFVLELWEWWGSCITIPFPLRLCGLALGKSLLCKEGVYLQCWPVIF